MQLQKTAMFGLFVLFSAIISSFPIFAQEVRPRRAFENSQTTTNNVSNGVQQRERGAVVVSSAPRSGVEKTVMSRPVGNAPKSILTNDLLVRPTVAARPVAATNSAASNSALAGFRARLLTAMSAKMGIPYRYGSQGPNTYDCSGLVWTVFNEAGIGMERTSAATFWKIFPAATEEETTQFGTLVFFNGLGHVGIVVDENTFYHASSSKGVTFSKFEGYWEKRIVGFRRVPLDQLPKYIK